MKSSLAWSLLGCVFLSIFSWRAAAEVQLGVVVSWGDNSSGQQNLPPGLTNIVAVAGGGFHSLALSADGNVTAWGSNSNGQTNVPSNLTNVIGLAAGASHSLALRGNGTVAAWGAGSKGETTVPAALTNAVSIAAGYSHNLALTANSRVIGWGLGTSGQTNIPANLTNAVSVACGAYHSLALKADGTVVGWGDNSYGQAKVPGWLTNVTAIGAGFRHSVAVRADGTVVGWGDSAYGQTNSPADLTNAIQISVGAYHNVALRADGTVACWGYNSSGQTNSPSGLSSVDAIASGFSHNLAITLHPLVLSEPPAVLELLAGATTSLVISVVSGPPMTYQWYFNQNPIPTATGTDLMIDTFDFSKAGAYSVVVSNQFGVVSATTAVRLTNSPVILVDGIDAGGGTVIKMDSAKITMSSSLPAARIYYTLDGTSPDFRAIGYTTNAIVLTNTATIRAVAYDPTYAVSAESAPLTVQIAPTYILATNTPGGGSIAVSPPPEGIGGRYVSNQVVTITATPADGWSFLHWAGDVSGTSNVITLSVDRPVSVLAIFGTDINLITNGTGQILLDPSEGPYPYGTALQLAAIPSAGAYFFGWGGALSGASDPAYVSVTNPITVTALFANLRSNEVSLTVLPNPGGTVNVTPQAQVYTNGAAVTLTALPGSNMAFAGWGGDASGATNPLVLVLDSSKVIRASFWLNASTNPPVITQQPVGQTIRPGGTARISLQATGDGSLLYQWRLNSEPLSAGTNITLLLSNTTPAQVGLYDAVVTSPFGAVTSSVASISLFGLQTALGGTQLIPLLTLDALPGSIFNLQFSPDLSQTNWLPLATVQVQNQRLYYIDSSLSNSLARFYRAAPK